jgi:hypothetical protein
MTSDVSVRSTPSIARIRCVDVEQVLGVAGGDAHQQVDLSAHAVGLHDFGDGRDRLGDAGQSAWRTVTLSIASIGRPSASGDGPFERLEDAATRSRRASRACTVLRDRPSRSASATTVAR